MRGEITGGVLRERIERQAGGAVGLASAGIPRIGISIAVGVHRCRAIQRERVDRVEHAIAVAVVIGHVAHELNGAVVDQQYGHGCVGTHHAERLARER